MYKEFKGFNNIDEIINYLEKDYKEIEYSPSSKKIENGKEITILGGPVYDPRVFAMWAYLEKEKYISEEYCPFDEYRKLDEQDWNSLDYSNLDIGSVSYIFLRIFNGERICEGLIDDYVKNGIILKLIKRAKKIKEES